MKKKKTQAKKRPASNPSLLPEEKTRRDILLKDLGSIDPKCVEKQITTPGLAFALVERLPLDDPRTPDLILAIRKAFEQKSVQKAVKKAIFKLKQKGISVPGDESDDDASILKVKFETEPPEAFLGPVDGAGSRPVFVAIPRIPSGYQVGVGIVNDETGIVDFVFGDYSKKRMKEVKDLFFNNFSAMIETSFAHAATVLEAGYVLNGPGSGTESLRHYRRLRPYIQDNIDLLEQAPIHDLIPMESPAGEVLTESRIDVLLDHEMMSSWLFDLGRMQGLMKEIEEVDESRILISEEQKTERIKNIKEKALDEYYTDSKRLHFKSRLEEMAYFFFKIQEEPLARTCLLAASSLDQQSSLAGPNLFLAAILERTLTFFRAAVGEAPEPGEEEGEETETPSIIVP